MKLDRTKILEAALAVLDEDGLEKLSLRAVAGRLDVKAMSLYWHFANKTELVRYVAQHFFARAYKAVDGELSWDAWLLAFGRALKEEFLGHRDAARLCATAQPGPDSLQHFDDLSAPLTRGGLGRNEALLCEAAVISFVLGWCSFDQNASYRERLQSQFDFQASFDAGLEALVTGLASRFAVSPAAP